MEHYFSPGSVSQSKKCVEGNATKIHCDTALALVTEHVNELKRDIAERANEDWDKKRSQHARRA
ncbi:hypothetical protein PIB30_002927 [Stylosanthes scabra]|uniref:Uncharacterized protein n=1 Tax=Stylosanthes scabra TaxID=79078 RepID=A0ABU6V1I3_9FABA|nr:hypothetical protein [Stylosanthes scabra]